MFSNYSPKYSQLTQTASSQSDKELTCMLRTTTVLALLNATVTKTRQSEAYTEICGRKEGRKRPAWKKRVECCYSRKWVVIYLLEEFLTR